MILKILSTLNASMMHFVLAALALVGLVALQFVGKNDQTITGILSGVIGAGIWGGIQRQLPPDNKDDINTLSNTSTKN